MICLEQQKQSCWSYGTDSSGRSSLSELRQQHTHLEASPDLSFRYLVRRFLLPSLASPPRIPMHALTQRAVNHRMVRCVPAAAVALAVLGCASESDSGGASGPAQARACLTSAATPVLPDLELPQQHAVPMKLYVDRSGSMAGYLDKNFGAGFGIGSGAANLRQLLNSITAVGGQTMAVYGFGNRVTVVKGTAARDVIGTLVSQGFYTDNNTRLEEVLDTIAKDTGRTFTHLIITDGRRGDGASAIAQYKRLGELGRAWAADPAKPGVFVVAAADAAFRKHREDRAGCWAATGTPSVFNCPIYVFGFLPLSASDSTLSALHESMQRIYATPVHSSAAISFAARRSSAPSGAFQAFDGQTPAKPLKLIFHSDSPQVSTVSLVVRADANGGTARYAATDSLVTQLYSAPLCATGARSWTRIKDPGSAWVRPGAVSDSAGNVLLTVDLRARAAVPQLAYKVELHSAGRPNWFDEFAAAEQGDATRTYGLQTLLDHLGPKSSRLGGFYVGIY